MSKTKEPKLNRAGTAPVRPSRGRIPVADGEESYRVSVATGATLSEQLDAAAWRRGLTRKERGADVIVANQSAVARVALELLVELDELGPALLDRLIDSGAPRGLIAVLRKALPK